jgi:hypothetical protein
VVPQRVADGAAAQRVSRANRVWRREFEETLPDLREEDIAGSGPVRHKVGPVIEQTMEI